MNRSLLQLLRRNKSMVISGINGEPWSIRVFYALYEGFVFLVNNVSIIEKFRKSQKVSFIVEDYKNKARYVAGRGLVEVLGDPMQYRDIRGVLVFKVPEDSFMLKEGNVVLVRIIPMEYITLYDLEEGFRVIEEKVNLQELKEDIKPTAKYFNALRPWSLQMGIADVVLGALIAPTLNILRLIISIFAVFLLQASANLISDFMDFWSGIDKATNLPPSSTRVLVDGLIPIRNYLMFTSVILSLGISLGIYAILIYPKVLLIGVLGIAASLIYGIPKFGLKWLALGDLSVFLVFGPGIILGSYIFQGGSIGSLGPILLSIGIGVIVTGVLHSNNWRDIKDDTGRGVKTIASFLGEKGSMIYYLTLIWSSYLFIGLSALVDSRLIPVLGSFLTLPWGVRLTKIALDNKNWKRNILDALTGQFQSLHMYFTIAFLVGYIIVSRLLFL